MFTGCSFEENHAQALGDAVFNLRGQPRFSGCTFARNGVETPNYGAVVNMETNARFDTCIFVNNLGGAMTNDSASVTVKHSMSWRNYYYSAVWS